jgi:hypothetical protein
LPSPPLPVPNVVHLVFGLSADFGGKNFSLVHYLAVAAIARRLQPDLLYMHLLHEPSGTWWDRAKPLLHIRQVRHDDVDTVFGKPVGAHVPHKADVVRMKLMVSEGGIYMDMDVIALRSMAELRRQRTVLGLEGQWGLGNGVILAAPQSPFMLRWLEQYRNWPNDRLTHFSVDLPLRLAREHPDEILLLPPSAFFTPLWRDVRQIFADDKYDYSLNYAMHLWETVSWAPYLHNLTVDELLKPPLTVFKRMVRDLL